MTVEEQLRQLPKVMLADRQARVRAALATAGLDCAIVASNGTHMIDAPNPLFHLTGFGSVGPCFVRMDRDGALRALGTPADDAERIRRFFPQGGEAVDEPADALARFAAVAAASGRVGLVGLDAAPRRLAEIVIAAVGARGAAFDQGFTRATSVKTTQEIANAVEATRIAEAGYGRLLALARPGLRECDLAVALNLFMKEQGADDCFLMLNAGPRADAVMPSSERPLESGDLVLVELSPSVGGQFVQICRTVVLGEPRQETREAYALLVSAARAGIAQVRPGARIGDACRAIDDSLSAAGYEAFSRPPFIRRRGHGLGAGSTFPGDVAVDNDARLETGMLFVIHPNQFLPQTGYMMCGEPVVVGREGAIVLSKRQASLDRAAAVAAAAAAAEATR